MGALEPRGIVALTAPIFILFLVFIKQYMLYLILTASFFFGRNNGGLNQDEFPKTNTLTLKNCTEE